MIPQDVQLLRDSFVDYAKHHEGLFYRWGGDDPSGYDCSGLTVECLKSVGLLPRKYDYTAEMLRDKFGAFKVESPYAGCLMFLLRDDGTARHVEIVINEFQTVGASGGGSTITSVEAAMEQNAFIKRRPIQTGPDVLFIDPFQVLTV
jgi:cell wall-associated NlpC family hydrolase